MTTKLKNIGGHFLMRFKFIFYFLVFSLIILGCGYFWWQIQLQPANSAGKEQAFVVKKGESIGAIAQRLEKEGFIKSAIAFKLIIYQENLGNKIQAGEFRIKSSVPAREIALALTHGAEDIWLTFPEGLRREEYIEIIGNNLASFDNQEFLNLTRDKEGQLFPDTYLVPKTADAAAVLKILLTNFEKKYQEIPKSELSQKQILTLASIVEREAKPPDREIVAGILIKRLNNGWPLQVDASVQYVLASNKDWWPQVSKADLNIKSPFNTYLNKGLPPGPICNPSLSSIKAVVQPLESEYWFYLTGTDGKMHYGVTAEDHAENIRKFLN